MADGGIYGAVAPFYDSANGSLDYKAWADMCESVMLEHSSSKPSLILDAACGTGSMTLELARRGYDMTGVDISPEMLCIARERAQEAGLAQSILFLCQDLGELELYGTVDAAVCTLDSINHITDKESLRSFFELLHRCYLIPDGIFIFDLNTPYRLEHFYGTNDFILEEEGMLCAWQSFYDPEERIAHFYLSVFKEGEDGRYDRTDVEQEERAYGLDEMKALLSECGIETLDVYSDLDRSPAGEQDERWYFVCRNTKK